MNKPGKTVPVKNSSSLALGGGETRPAINATAYPKTRANQRNNARSSSVESSNKYKEMKDESKDSKP